MEIGPGSGRASGGGTRTAATGGAAPPPREHGRGSAPLCPTLGTAWREEVATLGAELSAKASDGDLIEGFLCWVGRLNEDGLGSEAASRLVPWAAEPGGPFLGYAQPEFLERLVAIDGELARDAAGTGGRPGGSLPTFVDWATGEALALQPGADGAPSPLARGPVALRDSWKNAGERQAALDGLLEAARARGEVPGWRNERYPAAEAFGRPPPLSVERACAAALGVKAYGVHLNAFTRGGGRGGAEAGGAETGRAAPSSSPASPPRLWVARRSASKPTWPGKLDNAIAGGQPMGISLRENAIKECGEEAGVGREAAERALVATGAVSYSTLRPSKGLARDVMFTFDLELPADFEPTPSDGEVEGFVLLPARHAAALAALTGLFKDNCNLVIADWCLRWGILSSDAPGYLDLLRGLRSGDCT